MILSTPPRVPIPLHFIIKSITLEISSNYIKKKKKEISSNPSLFKYYFLVSSPTLSSITKSKNHNQLLSLSSICFRLSRSTFLSLSDLDSLASCNVREREEAGGEGLLQEGQFPLFPFINYFLLTRIIILLLHSSPLD